MSSDRPELQEVQAYIWYVWDCPACGETQEHEVPDVDPSGGEVTCRHCDRVFLATGSAS